MKTKSQAFESGTEVASVAEAPCATVQHKEKKKKGKKKQHQEDEAVTGHEEVTLSGGVPMTQEAEMQGEEEEAICKKKKKQKRNASQLAGEAEEEEAVCKKTKKQKRDCTPAADGEMLAPLELPQAENNDAAFENPKKKRKRLKAVVFADEQPSEKVVLENKTADDACVPTPNGSTLVPLAEGAGAEEDTPLSKKKGKRKAAGTTPDDASAPASGGSVATSPADLLEEDNDVLEKKKAKRKKCKHQVDQGISGEPQLEASSAALEEKALEPSTWLEAANESGVSYSKKKKEKRSDCCQSCRRRAGAS
mmetsp:Transcript_27211/g.50039  ORF Transcript_27211/g.50039 Transcript_27211/m.50039 type:complete len:307 (-) Transcript_27211:503-1423(-)